MSEYTGSKRHGWTFTATASGDRARAIAICVACGVTRDVMTGGRLSLGGRCDGEWQEPPVQSAAKTASPA